MFTRKTTMGEVMAYPTLKTLAKFILPQPPEGADAAGGDDGQQAQGPDPAQMMAETFEQLCGAVSPAWNPDSMAEGFNAIVGHINNGVPMVQDIYTPAEIAGDDTKARAGLLWFPAKKKGPFALVCAGGPSPILLKIMTNSMWRKLTRPLASPPAATWCLSWARSIRDIRHTTFQSRRCLGSAIHWLLSLRETSKCVRL